MKALVAYYSRTGNTKKVAEAIAKAVTADTEEIISIKKRKGLFNYLLSGREAMRKISAKIEPVKKNPEDYDIVIIGTPIWGFAVSSPIRAYAEYCKGKVKKTAFFSTAGGSSAKNTFNDLSSIIGIKPCGTIELKTSEVKTSSYFQKLKTFIEKF